MSMWQMIRLAAEIQRDCSRKVVAQVGDGLEPA